MRRVAMFSGLVLAAGLAVFVSSPRAQTSEDVNGCYKEISPDQAINYCTRAIGAGQLSASKLAIIFTNRGNAYNSKGDYDRAIQDFSQAIRLDPKCAYAFNGLGNAYNGEADYDQAIQNYDRAIRLISNYGYAFNGRGNAYNSKGDYDRAIQDFDQAIRLNPNFAYAFNGRGNSYNDKGNYDRAIQDYGQAVRLNPNYADAFFNRGNAYNHKGDYDRAIQDYDQAIRLNPSFADAFFNRGFTRFKEGSIAMAVSDFAKSAELVPANRYNILWSYVAAARARQNADPALLNTQGLDLESWPGPVLSLFLRKKDRNALLKEARDPDAEKEHDRLCEAHFFLAEYELLAGVEKAAEADFQEAVDTCRPTVVEYAAAAAELKRLPGQSPSQIDANKKPDVNLR